MAELCDLSNVKYLAKEVHRDHLWCECTRMKAVILNHQCVDHPDIRKMKKKMSELESKVDVLTRELEQLKASEPGRHHTLSFRK